MARQTFIQAFSPYLQNSTNMISRSLLQNKQDEEERKRQEAEAQRQSNILNQLVSGKKNAYNYGGKFSPLIQGQAPLNQQDMVGLLSGASDDTLQRFGLFQKLNEVKQIAYGEPIMREDNPNILRWNKDAGKLESTDQPNPFYKEKLLETSEFLPAETVQGLEKWKGYTVEQKVYLDKDGNVVKRGGFGNPMKPTWKTGGSGGKDKVFDLDAFKEKVGAYSKREADLSLKVDKYKKDNIGNAPIGTYGNAINKAYDKEEISFYNELPPDAQNYINENFYTPMSESDVPEDYAYKNKDQLYESYMADLNDDYTSGKLTVDMKNYDEGISEETARAEIYRAAQLWGKLKFKRL